MPDLSPELESMLRTLDDIAWARRHGTLKVVNGELHYAAPSPLLRALLADGAQVIALGATDEECRALHGYDNVAFLDRDPPADARRAPRRRAEHPEEMIRCTNAVIALLERGVPISRPAVAAELWRMDFPAMSTGPWKAWRDAYGKLGVDELRARFLHDLVDALAPLAG